MDQVGETMADMNNWSNGIEQSTTGTTAGPPYTQRTFEIRVRGYLNSRWSEWLEGLEVKYLENGEMILFGPIIDQAALLGILNKLSYLNLALLSVNEVKTIDFLEEE